MARPSRLLYSHQRSGAEPNEDTVVLFECPEGIPAGWLFCFGGRNFWNPDDKVSDRGGTAAERNRFETPLDVADARLGNARDALESVPHLWVWFQPLELLHRRILSRGKTGFLRLDATWAFSGHLGERVNSIPAYAENYINAAATDQLERLEPAAKPLQEFAPFVPVCEPTDRKRFEKAAARREHSGHRGAAALAVGVPTWDHELFLSRLDEVYQPVFEGLDSLPPYPVKAALPTAKAVPGDDGGLLSRLKRFGRRS